ncbi:hypothetical protein VDGL01_10236 [Verticillium dahliae]
MGATWSLAASGRLPCMEGFQCRRIRGVALIGSLGGAHPGSPYPPGAPSPPKHSTKSTLLMRQARGAPTSTLHWQVLLPIPAPARDLARPRIPVAQALEKGPAPARSIHPTTTAGAESRSLGPTAFALAWSCWAFASYAPPPLSTATEFLVSLQSTQVTLTALQLPGPLPRRDFNWPGVEGHAFPTQITEPPIAHGTAIDSLGLADAKAGIEHLCDSMPHFPISGRPQRLVEWLGCAHRHRCISGIIRHSY